MMTAANPSMASPRIKIPVPKGFLAAALHLLNSTNIKIRSVAFGELSYSFMLFRVLILCSYACRTDPNSGSCGSDVISVCVSGSITSIGNSSTWTVSPVPQWRTLIAKGQSRAFLRDLYKTWICSIFVTGTHKYIFDILRPPSVL